jgi:hypothetical protein
MNSVVNRYHGHQSSSLTQCEPPPQRCSTCGMLECLCRPRFFAGQVLTADDLNRLKHYVIAKNRLHNRQLHGWGVVNGLEVTCDACGTGVIVSCGYALSPCGDDIVVCEPVTVDVCALIKKCCQADCNPCEPPPKTAPVNCDEESEWILAIRYTESPAKGIKPLMSSEAPGCGCATSESKCTCGHGNSHGHAHGHAHAKSGCGCGGGAGKCNCSSTGTKAKPRTAPVQCEPTIVCEGFAFDVYKKPPDTDDDDDKDGLQLNPNSELYQRFACCIDLLWTRLPKMPGEMNPQNVQANPSAWRQWACAFKDYLKKYLSTKPGYNCELLARLNEIICPPANSQNLAAQLPEIIVLLWYVWFDAVLACFCSALLPPCPEPYPHGCVPLASIKVSGGQCRVLSICNWTIHRKFATTFPALQYWLSIFPFGAILRNILDQVCCFQISVPEFDTPVPGTTAVPVGIVDPTSPQDVNALKYQRASARVNPKVEQVEKLHVAAQMARAVVARGMEPIDPHVLIESALLKEKDKGAKHLTAAEIANFPQFLALNQLLRPIALGALSAPEMAPLLARAASFKADATGAAAAAADVDALKKEVAGLRADVTRQADEIKALKRGRKGGEK